MLGRLLLAACDVHNISGASEQVYLLSLMVLPHRLTNVMLSCTPFKPVIVVTPLLGSAKGLATIPQNVHHAVHITQYTSYSLRQFLPDLGFS